MARILIVEDDPGYQELIELLTRPHLSRICNNAEEAEGCLASELFDAVICDIDLLGISGLELLRRMQSQGLTKRVPVVICSASSDETVKDAAHKGGAAAFIAKPFEHEALKLVMSRLLVGA